VVSTEAYQAFTPVNLLRVDLFWKCPPPLGRLLTGPQPHNRPQVHGPVHIVSASSSSLADISSFLKMFQHCLLLTCGIKKSAVHDMQFRPGGVVLEVQHLKE
jgi:hypothetical protein